jgi:hypothetical protein
MDEQENVPTEIDTWIDEKFTAPGISDKFELDGRTYVCTDITWDRESDEITATYKNQDKPDDPSKLAAVLTYYQTESAPLQHPSQQPKPKASDGTKNVINFTNPPRGGQTVEGIHPSQM